MGGMPTSETLEEEKLGWCGKYPIVASCILYICIYKSDSET